MQATANLQYAYIVVLLGQQAEVEQGFTRLHMLPLVIWVVHPSFLMCLCPHILQEIRYTDEQP